MSETTLHPSDGTALTPVGNAGAPAARWGGSSRRSGVSGWLALVMAAVAGTRTDPHSAPGTGTHSGACARKGLPEPSPTHGSAATADRVMTAL